MAKSQNQVVAVRKKRLSSSEKRQHCGCTNIDYCPPRAKADVAGCCSVTNPLREESEVEGWVNKAAELLTLKTMLLKAYFCT